MSEITIELRIIIYLTLFFVSVLVYFVLFLIYSHVSRNIRNTRKAKIRLELMESIRNKQAISIPKKRLFHNTGLEETSELLEELQDSHIRLSLKEYFSHLGFEKYVHKVMRSTDKHSIAFIIKLIGNLQLDHVEETIRKAIYKNKKSVDFQYIGLEALSKLRQDDMLCQIFNDETIHIKLTYRAFQNVFLVYTSDKKMFYEKLLEVKDQYVVRIIIKLIGNEAIYELKSHIRRFLSAEDKNMKIAVIDSLGMLKDQESYEAIRNLCADSIWEVRSAAVKAISQIDLEASVPTLIEGLKDSEWWVRYNSASALVHSKDIDRIQRIVASEDDVFAKEIINYVIQKMKITEDTISDKSIA